MSLGWTLLGTLGQLALANFMFMLAVFAGGGLASGTSRSKSVLRVLDLSMYLLPTRQRTTAAHRHRYRSRSPAAGSARSGRPAAGC